jgi:DSF synthase
MSDIALKAGSSSIVTPISEHPSFCQAGPMQAIVPAHVEVANMRFENLDVELDPEARTFWMHMRPEGRGCFTLGLLQDIIRTQHTVKQMFADRSHERRGPFDYFVLASRTEGTFNLGGDLGLFAEKIRTRDRAALTHYAHTCIDAVYNNHVAFGVPVVTIALVAGDALGGGFESALACDMIVAEKGAKLGLPEILFNLFPGMGAYSFLSRRLDAVRAEKLILGGRTHTAEELHEMGIVDILAEDGEGELAVRRYIDQQSYRHNAYRSVFQTRRRVNRVSYEELRDVTDIWVDAALNLTDSDLRRMARLTAAQDRRRAALDAASVAALSAE